MTDDHDKPIDMRFVELRAEIRKTLEYLAFVEEQLESASKRAEDKLSHVADEDSCRIATQDFDCQLDHFAHRFVRGTYLITLWAVFESGIGEIAKLVGSEKSSKLSLRDINGRSPRERITKFFEKVLCYDIGIGDDAWRELELISSVRNAFCPCQWSTGFAGRGTADLAQESMCE